MTSLRLNRCFFLQLCQLPSGLRNKQDLSDCGGWISSPGWDSDHIQTHHLSRRPSKSALVWRFYSMRFCAGKWILHLYLYWIRNDVNLGDKCHVQVRKSMYAFKSKLWSHFKRVRVPAKYWRYPVMNDFLFSGVAPLWTYCVQWIYCG